MFLEITSMTLKRLTNYEAVVERECLEAEKRQWRVMTLEVMQAAEKAKVRFREVNAAVAYARYLHGVQGGRDHVRYIHGESLISRSLVGLMEELAIDRRLVPAAQTGCP